MVGSCGVVFGSLVTMFWALSKAKEKIAFVASCLYICGMLVGAALALYLGVLPSSVDPVYSLSIYNTAATHHGLTRGRYLVARRNDSGTGIFRVYLSPIRWEDPRKRSLTSAQSELPRVHRYSRV